VTYLTQYSSDTTTAGGKTALQVAQGLSLGRSTVKRHLTYLYKHGAVKQVRDTGDQRRVLWFRT
jgi:predicted ArsR family transcriptional regulator